MTQPASLAYLNHGTGTVLYGRGQLGSIPVKKQHTPPLFFSRCTYSLLRRMQSLPHYTVNPATSAVWCALNLTHPVSATNSPGAIISIIFYTPNCHSRQIINICMPSEDVGASPPPPHPPNPTNKGRV